MENVNNVFPLEHNDTVEFCMVSCEAEIVKQF